MIRITRRGFLLSTTALVPAGLIAGCVATPAAPGVPATVTLSPMVVADVQGLVGSVNALLTDFVAADPNAIPASQLAILATGQTAANSALASLAGTTFTPASGSALQIINTYLNYTLQAIGAVLPAAALLDPKLAPLVPIYDVSVVLVQKVLEPQISLLVGQVITAASSLKTISANPPTVAAAKAAIAIP